MEPQSPDGVNVTITNLILDTDEQAFEVIRLMRAIKEGQKIDIDKVVKMFSDHQV